MLSWTSGMSESFAIGVFYETAIDAIRIPMRDAENGLCVETGLKNLREPYPSRFLSRSEHMQGRQAIVTRTTVNR